MTLRHRAARTVFAMDMDRPVESPVDVAKEPAAGRLACAVSLALWAAVVVLLAWGLVFRWGLARRQPLDFDEFHHLHVAWCWTQGLIPYRDFWDNHPPLMHLLLACLQPIRGETVETLFVWRLAAFGMAVAVLAATFVLARRVFDSATGLAAVALLACVQVFTDKTVEVRPDLGMILFCVLTVWLVLRAMDGKSRRARAANWAAAGVCFGLATLFSTKSLMAAVALAVGLVGLALCRWSRRLRSGLGCGGAQECPRGQVLGIARGLGWALLGFCLPVAPVVVFFAGHGLLAEMLRFTVLENVGYPDRFSAVRSLGPVWSTPVALTFGLGLLLAGIGQFRKWARRDASLVLLIVAVVLVIEYGFIMPAPYAHSVCLPLVFLAVFGGWVLRSAIGLVTRPRMSAVAAWGGGAGAVLILVAGMADSLVRLGLSHQGDAAELHRQLALTSRVLELTGTDDAVFSDAPVAVFRRQACFYPTLYYGVLDRYRRGEIKPSIAEDLRRVGCALVVTSFPPRLIPPDDERFVQTHFVQIEPQLYVPGRSFSPEELGRGPVVFEVVTPGVYTIDAATDVLVDGEPVTTEVRLERGNHTVGASSDSGWVRIYRRPGQGRRMKAEG